MLREWKVVVIGNFMNKHLRTLPIQGFRVFLMMSIVLLHTYGNKPVFGGGSECVSFFFVVSGFLYRDKLVWKEYIIKKMLGMFPAYWMVLLIHCMMSMLGGVDKFTIDIIPYALLIQSWIPQESVFYALKYVGVTWFLSSLLFCYIFSPICYRLINRYFSKRSLLLMIFFYLCVLSCLELDKFLSLGGWLAYISPVVRIFEYLMGMCLWSAIREKQQVHLSKRKDILAIFFVLAYFSFIYFQILGGGTSIIHVLLIAFIFIYDSDMIKLLFANKWIVWLSSYVMFVYLSHQSLTLSCLGFRVEALMKWLSINVDIHVVMVALCWINGIIFGLFYNKFIRPYINNNAHRFLFRQ